MFCTSCGKSIPDGSKFCPECGAAIAVNAVPTQAPQAVPQMEAPQAAPQNYQMPPQGYQMPPQGYQAPAYSQPGYAPAPKSVSFGALWNNNTKRPLFYMFGIAFTVLIAMFFNFAVVDGWWRTYGISGYELLEYLEDGEFLGILALFSLFTTIGIMVFAVLGLFKEGMGKKVFKLIFMISSLVYATFSFLIFIIIASEDSLGFGAVLNLLLGGGMVFVYFFFLNKIYSNKPAAPQPVYQPVYNQPTDM